MLMFRATAQFLVRGMSRNLIDGIRLFCTAAIFIAAASQLTLNLSEPVIFMISTIAGALFIALLMLVRALRRPDNASS